ncbi:putative tudor domain-containing protein 1 isoform 2 [Scophthalmus maximus]|uniref:Putative tudor domain-containing protein 1 isoform 2 n=1 Tax=Scophthalmus maximus TaxID=52904 RepID=A0A2U9CMG6_SCOMX|nr:putative tudor domain-containing protein 1 isoform 2 [Scophthalmus maximus]
MNRSFSPNLVRPNLPLRKPSSSPVAVSSASTPPRPFSGPGVTAPGATGDGEPPPSLAQRTVGDNDLTPNLAGPVQSRVSRDIAAVLGSEPPALTVYICNFCGQQGNFRCKRCKKTPYCSVTCQTEDWKVHRHTCRSIDQEPAKEKPKEVTASPAAGERTGQLEMKPADASTLPRVYLKDLNMTKIATGTDFQVSVVEFYSPGRFYLHAQSPELQEALQVISTELQKTYNCASVTTYVPCVGEVCGVQFSCDRNWYRGLVQTLSADQKTTKILYIDFGNEEDVPVERIRPLTANIQPFSPCAMECRIAGVVPSAGNWSGQCSIAVRQLLGGKAVTAKLVETPESGHVHAVDILLSMGKKLSVILLEHGFAEEQVNATPTRQDINSMTSASLENFKRRSSGKDDNAWAQPPEPLTQAVGESFPVVITHFQSPSDIIVQKVEHAGVIQELQFSLREHCCQVPAPQNFRPAPGTVCCAQFSEDKQWYRSKVLAYPSEERVCVGYLDFGNSEEVDLVNLRAISTSLLALPMQAMPCGLAGVQPVGERWSEDCLLALQRRLSNRILRIEIQGQDPLAGKALVAMIDEASDPQANVAELLISAGYAAPAPVTTASDQQVDQTTIASAEPHVSLPAREPLVWSFTKIPCDGQTVVLLPSVVDNPGEFYCRVDNLADHQRLIELGVELKQHCETDNSPFEPTVGEPCCAMFPGDGAWYRAMVKELSENHVSVNIVDYGYSMNIERSHLRSITPRLLTLPFQAIRCWLSGVEPLGSEWSSEALLWFQTRVDSELLSARVLSATERGYGVELKSRGQNVADALISEQLAKVPGKTPKETHANTGSEAKYQKSAKDNEHSQMHAQASNQAGASSKQKPTEGQTAVPSEVPSFPVDWKAAELPLNQTFKPYIVAVTSPSLFYLPNPSQRDQQKLQQLMMEVAAFCTNNQASLSSAVLSIPAPGAACCAQFSGDNNWYRAVILEVGKNEMCVIYADYGNIEKVPFSRILPIPMHLLQLPFQITRCTLTGKEHFPVVWPEEVQQMFQNTILNGVLATVQSFDGSANVLSLTLPSEMGGGHVTAMLVDALLVQNKSDPRPATTRTADQANGSTPTASTPAEPHRPPPRSILESLNGLNHTATAGQSITSDPKPQTHQQDKNTSADSVSDSPVQKIIEQKKPPVKVNPETNDRQTSGCCCASLKTKIDQLEQLMQLQLSLIKLLVGQRK